MKFTAYYEPKYLVPIEVFGAGLCADHPFCDECETHEGYGLMDSIGAQSDCNRAAKHMFRIADPRTDLIPEGAIPIFVKVGAV